MRRTPTQPPVRLNGDEAGDRGAPRMPRTAWRIRARGSGARPRVSQGFAIVLAPPRAFA